MKKFSISFNLSLSLALSLSLTPSISFIIIEVRFYLAPPSSFFVHLLLKVWRKKYWWIINTTKNYSANKLFIFFGGGVVLLDFSLLLLVSSLINFVLFVLFLVALSTYSYRSSNFRNSDSLTIWHWTKIISHFWGTNIILNTFYLLSFKFSMPNDKQRLLYLAEKSLL